MRIFSGHSRFEISRAFLFLGAAVFLLSAPLLAPPAQAGAVKIGQGDAPVKINASNPALGLQNSFIDVAATVSPAVVNISSEWTEDVSGFSPRNGDDFFSWPFFNGPGGQNGRPPVQKRKQRSLGSGFLITSDGYILTNAHVIDKAQKVTVTFEDGSSYQAKVVGKYEKVDIGVVKITDANRKFPHVVLGDSDGIKVGQWAIAIGNPFALDHTVTTGIISAKGRSVEMGQEGGYQYYIQTDASINPGNSGGPLCDIQGQVIGINSAIYSQSGGSVGIGFAIPSNIARKTAEDLINEGKVTRAGLGAVVQSLTGPMAKSFGLTTTQGALINDVTPGSAAEKAGLKHGDIVTALNGDPITDSGDLVAKLYTFKPGDTVKLTILRDGKQSQVPVSLQKLEEATPKDPQNPTTASGHDGESQSAGESLGMNYQDQDEDLKQDLPAGAPAGPVVTQVAHRSPAATAGIQPGDIILQAGNTKILSAKQLAVTLNKNDLKKGLRLFVWREGSTRYTFLQDTDE